MQRHTLQDKNSSIGFQFTLVKLIKELQLINPNNIEKITNYYQEFINEMKEINSNQSDNNSRINQSLFQFE